jgi:hypothetical protein
MHDYKEFSLYYTLRSSLDCLAVHSKLRGVSSAECGVAARRGDMAGDGSTDYLSRASHARSI